MGSTLPEPWTTGVEGFVRHRRSLLLTLHQTNCVLCPPYYGGFIGCAIGDAGHLSDTIHCLPLIPPSTKFPTDNWNCLPLKGPSRYTRVTSLLRSYTVPVETPREVKDSGWPIPNVDSTSGSGRHRAALQWAFWTPVRPAYPSGQDWRRDTSVTKTPRTVIGTKRLNPKNGLKLGWQKLRRSELLIFEWY